MDDVFDDCGSDGEADTRFEDELDSFLHEIFGDVFEEEEKALPSDDKELRKFYRELCLRYHPDKMGLHNAKRKRLWLSIQETYRNNDYAKLRTIRADESWMPEECVNIRKQIRFRGFIFLLPLCLSQCILFRMTIWRNNRIEQNIEAGKDYGCIVIQ